MKRSQNTSCSPTRLRNSFKNAFRGIGILVKHTPNARIHLTVALAVVLLAGLLRVSSLEWCILLGCIVLVLALEGINSALEQLADKVSSEFSPLIRNAKDLAAGAVLIASIGAALIGLTLLLPYLFS